MNFLEERIARDGIVREGNVLKVGSFLNHQMDIALFQQMGEEFARRFAGHDINKIVTIESSGIGIACVAAQSFGVPVVFAKKAKSLNIDGEVYTSKVESFTHKCKNQVIVSKKFLGPEDKVLIIDDFLANGAALEGLISLVRDSGAILEGVGIGIEKGFQPGGDLIRGKGIQVESLAIVDSMDDKTGKISYAYNAEEITDGFFPTIDAKKEEWYLSNSFDQKAWERCLHYLVMFRSSGVEAFHSTDREQQVMFNVDNAQDFVLITFRWENTKEPHEKDTRNRISRVKGTFRWCVNTTKGEVIYSNSSLTQCIKWVMNNFDQYRKQICWSHIRTENKLIREYLDKEYGMPLKKYFDDNCHNSDYILRRYFPLYRLYLRDSGFDEEYQEHFTVNDKNDPKIDELISEVTEDHADEFYMWLYKNVMYARHDPEASFFLTNPRLVKNQWLIHFTRRNEALDICQNGFKMGIPKNKISQLAYTQKVKPEEKTSDGYIYAYDADKIFEGNLSLKMIENASAAVLFQANGLKLHHETDREDQVIVLPQTVKNKVLIFQTDHVNGGWQVAKNNFTEEYCQQVHKIPEKLGNVLISPSEYNSIDNVISWVENNYQQYKNVIGWDKRDKLKENIELIEEKEIIQEDVLATSESAHIRILRNLGILDKDLRLSKSRSTRGLDRDSAYTPSFYFTEKNGFKPIKLKFNLNGKEEYTRAYVRVSNHPCRLDNSVISLQNNRSRRLSAR